MTPPKVLLDTDILSAIMRRHPNALIRAQRYLSSWQRLSISIITRYEIMRGLKAIRAAAQLARFETLCDSLEVLSLNDAVVARASDIYADLHQRGEIIGDADILIAATAIVNGFTLASNNERHHERIEGISLDNWLKNQG